ATTPGRVDLSWSASSDAVGVAGYSIIRNGVAIANVSGSTLSFADTTVAPNTTYSYTVTASDAAGNVSAPSAPATVATPAAPPDPSITSAPSAYVRATDATISFGSSPAGAAFACSLDSAAPSTCTSPVTYSSLGEGTHSFAVAASNAGGTDPTPA